MKIVDLTALLDEDTPVYPGDPSVLIQAAGRLAEDGFNDHSITFGTHIGTHIDAPYHMISDGKKLNDFPVSRFVGRGVCIDARTGFSVESVKTADLQEDDIVFFLTGKSDKYSDPEYFENYEAIPRNVADILIERKIKIVGMDMCSPDHEPFDIHTLLLGNDILIIENLVNLKPLVAKEFTVYALPLKLAVDGAPVRVIAVLDEAD